MKILFFLVHPAKFHFHKVQINSLIERGHEVQILIIKKDILEDLVKSEGWKYKNIYPEGRKIKGLHTYISAAIATVRTIYRLLNYTKNNKFDLYVGDFLTWVGKARGVPSLYPTDDVLSEVPEQQIFLFPATNIIAPKITDLGKYDYKTIRYDGYKSLAHLHPNFFSPDINKIALKYRHEDFFLIRCVGFNATHDLDKHGISDEILRKLIKILEPHGKILISSERELPKDIMKYLSDIDKSDISHYMSFCKLFISDSTTMTSEACILGTFSIEYDNYFEYIEQMKELSDRYHLTRGFSPDQGPEKMYDFVERFIKDYDKFSSDKDKNLNRLLEEKIDVSNFLLWIYENFPESANQAIENPNIQYEI